MLTKKTFIITTMLGSLGTIWGWGYNSGVAKYEGELYKLRKEVKDHRNDNLKNKENERETVSKSEVQPGHGNSQEKTKKTPRYDVFETEEKKDAEPKNLSDFINKYLLKKTADSNQRMDDSDHSNKKDEIYKELVEVPRNNIEPKELDRDFVVPKYMRERVKLEGK